MHGISLTSCKEPAWVRGYFKCVSSLSCSRTCSCTYTLCVADAYSTITLCVQELTVLVQSCALQSLPAQPHGFHKKRLDKSMHVIKGCDAAASLKTHTRTK